MCRKLKLLILQLGILFLLPPALLAQEDEEDLVPDSVVVAPPSVIQEGGSIQHFDKIEGAGEILELKLQDSLVQKLKNDDNFWYVNEKPLREKPRQSFYEKEWFRTLMWFLMVGAFVAIIIWFLAASNIGLFRRKIRPLAETEHYIEETENIFEIDYEKEISKAIAAKDYNLAIRLYYLQVLKEMSDRGLIKYAQDKTNSEYVWQLTGTRWHKDFFRLTRQFDYAWYGRFPVSDEAFEILRKDFIDFKRSVSA